MKRGGKIHIRRLYERDRSLCGIRVTWHTPEHDLSAVMLQHWEHATCARCCAEAEDLIADPIALRGTRPPSGNPGWP